MSKKFFISYGDKNYSIQRKRIGFQAKMFDFFDEIIIYKKRDLTKEFCQRFSNILRYPTGGGFWIWKSHLPNLQKIERNLTHIMIFLGTFHLLLKG